MAVDDVKSMHLEVVSVAEVRRGTSAKTQKPYELIEQVAVWHQGTDYPEKIKITVPADIGSAGYPVGHYSVDLVRSIRRGQYDGLRVFELFLIRWTPEEVTAWRKGRQQAAA